MTPEEAAAHSAAAGALGDTPRVFELLGDTLVGAGGKSVPLSSITGELDLGWSCKKLMRRLRC